MEHNYLNEVLPFLKKMDKNIQWQFEEYFKTAPLWLLDSLMTDNVKAGSVVITENEPANMIYFVADGRVKATDYRVLGIAFDFMKPKNLIAFGGMEALMKQECYKATIETVTDCIIVKLSRDKYEKWIFSDIEALRKETLITCTYLLEEERRNRLYLFLQGSDRLALMFIHCYEQYNHNGIVCINESRQGMTDATGLCLKSISRAVKRFVSEEMITKKGNKIYISSRQYEMLKSVINDKVDR